MNKVCRFLPVLFIFIATGCGTFHLGVKESQINVEQYPTPQEFLKTQDLAKKNIFEPEFLKILGTTKEQNLTQVNKAEEVQKNLFGTLTPHADKNAISDISAWILSHHMFSLPYKNVRTEFYFDWFPISYNILEFGPDMNILFITKKDETDPSAPYVLTRAIVSGTENNRTKDKEYIWEGIFNALKGSLKLLF